MPYIIKDIKGTEIQKGVVVNDKKEKDSDNFELENSEGKGVTYEEVMQMKSSYSHLNSFNNLNYLNDNERVRLIKGIAEVDQFYENIWERTLIELMFITNYYMSLISNLNSFEQIYKSGTKFEYWFSNNVKYTMLEKIKEFYIKTSKAYAEFSPIDIYEQDVEHNAKEIILKIDNFHLKDVEHLLATRWNETLTEFIEWNQKQEAKRKTMIFD